MAYAHVVYVQFCDKLVILSFFFACERVEISGCLPHGNRGKLKEFHSLPEISGKTETSMNLVGIMFTQ